MSNLKRWWPLLAGLAVLIAVSAGWLVWQQSQPPTTDPWQYLPERVPPTNHSALMEGPYASGPDVTRACLECHAEAGEAMLHTVHWRWEREPIQFPNQAEPAAVGKKNQINNFCIGIQSNWPPCTSCHTGYGWEDETFDFGEVENVDCLVCHDTTGLYVKAASGYPAVGVDLANIAQNVGYTSRETCGGCHFKGGGGDAVKHGDLDTSLIFPTERIDVHMGGHDFVCTDCHQTEDHAIKGRTIPASQNDPQQVRCTDCHTEDLHEDERINAHVDSLACQTCHLPVAAKEEPTKMDWDWSTAGQDFEEDPHAYLKIKGSFVYEAEFTPEYRWYNGMAGRYLLGDPINPDGPTPINLPSGDISDPNAKIWPFKIHRASQIYDTGYNTLIQPTTAGEGGFWDEFDWDKAARLGSEAVGLPYSGQYGFTETEMYWPLAHMISPADEALQCAACHTENDAPGRLDWTALGYDGDPIYRGGRQQQNLLETDSPAAPVSNLREEGR